MSNVKKGQPYSTREKIPLKPEETKQTETNQKLRNNNHGMQTHIFHCGNAAEKKPPENFPFPHAHL